MKAQAVLTALVGAFGLAGSTMASDGFSFLFLGDAHYHAPTWRSAERVRAIAEDVRRKGYAPDFVAHVGDLIENQEAGRPVSNEAGAQEWRYALADVKQAFAMPFFMALGNHDWYGGGTWFGGRDNIEAYYFPFMEKELGKPLHGKPFFSFRWKHAYFLFVNHIGFDEGLDREQRAWLRKSLAYAERNPAIERVFVIGHPVLWNLDFVRFNENHGLLDIIRSCKKVDAYLCGHTHHNSASVWAFGPDHRLLQVNGCPLGSSGNSEALLPIGQRALILNPPPAARGYTKGFRELDAYFVVSVAKEGVTVALERIGGDCVWEFGWVQPGVIEEKRFLGRPAEHALSREQLGGISRARLHLLPYVPEVIRPECAPLDILLNGKKVAELPRRSGGWEISRSRDAFPVPPECIRLENTVAVTNPNREQFAIRDAYLEVELASGETVLTPVCPNVLFAGDWRDLYMEFGLSHPGAGVLHSSVEVNIPEELIRCTSLGDPIMFRLDFNR
ncbi:MAG: hypothetical protein GX608_08075 [Lentisphaerae bacterium]|nr:hypothetical protein [Lentisphaerota bacterium]